MVFCNNHLIKRISKSSHSFKLFIFFIGQIFNFFRSNVITFLKFWNISSLFFIYNYITSGSFIRGCIMKTFNCSIIKSNTTVRDIHSIKKW